MFLYSQGLFQCLSLLIFSLFLSFFILLLSFRISAYNPDVEKLSPYECGFEPYEDARNAFDVKFYLIALIFIVFDLETAFFFPWVTCLSYLSSTSLWSIVDFFFELVVGLIYAWLVGALDWNSENKKVHDNQYSLTSSSILRG